MAPDSMSPDLCIMAKNSFDIIRSKELCCTIAGVLSVYDPRLGNKCNHLGDNMSVMFLTNIYPPRHPYSIITYNKIGKTLLRNILQSVYLLTVTSYQMFVSVCVFVWKG